MQSSIPGITDLSDEPEYIHRLYGTDSKNDFQKYYAMQCLRSQARGTRVRFIEITCPLTHVNNSP